MEPPRESACGCAGSFQCPLCRFLGTGLTDEDGQKSDIDNPACDCLIVHWAVLFMFLQLDTKGEWHVNVLEASKVALNNRNTNTRSVCHFLFLFRA